ncbi:SDR family oxidoreductase [Halalkalibacter krulwichiae]|uniref:NADP-dependent 3-hydroxy acid dehydrogenase YdfG n=1 Tax=Halalkalibacter krulwichiae TaxID=199441 RepID=A0A1X9MA03_9BACI|nr:SDR family oxidoreductase [Halalkalibacter krulwichiae]ARK28421.1 NADP-dependent 3-hydroxy acid dehydrogenase YdfG [Halalkalibacter krulwichiae]
MDKQIVLITGSSSGFGYLTTLELAKRGYLVIATMRDLTKKTALIHQAKQLNITENIITIQLDVTDETQLQKLEDTIKQRFGKIDILINNAGYSVGGVTEQIDVNTWKAQLETNVFGVIAVTKAFLPLMRERRAGKIINIGSISGQFGFPGLGPYVTSKFALSGFSESLRLELLPFNIHVSLIEAGSFKTKIWTKALNQKSSYHNEDYDQFVSNVRQAANRSADDAEDPQKVIHVILQICTAERPKFRYQVGKGVKRLLALKNFLPWPIIEWAIQKKLYNQKRPKS